MASSMALRRSAPCLRSIRPVFAPAFTRFASSSAPTTDLSQNEGMKLLNEQRNKRPISPHMTIYQPQLTWYSSIFNRITGTGLSVGLYAFSLAYLVGPAVGLPFDGASVVSAIQSLPAWVKYAGKVVIGVPFWFHTFNGLRHLSWDMGFVLDLKKSYAAGYTVIAATAIATFATAFLV